MKRVLKFVLSIFTFLSLFLQTGIVYADSLCPPAGNFGNLCNLKAENAGATVGKIVSVLLIVAIILALLYLVYGGIKYITSGGDKAKIDGARAHITAAIVGLVIAFLSFFILNVITYVFTGKAFGDFTLPTLF